MTTAAVSQAKTGIEVTLDKAIEHGRLNVSKFVGRDIWAILKPESRRVSQKGHPALLRKDGVLVVFKANGHAITLLAGMASGNICEGRDSDFHGDNEPDGPEEEAQP